MIVVLDSNVVVRAAFRRHYDPDNLLERARRGEFETATSTPLLDELEIALGYSHLRSMLNWDVGERAEFVTDYAAASLRIEPEQQLNIVRDPRDNRFLELAVEAEASYIVTTDKDLLDLVEYEGVKIVTQPQFLTILNQQGQTA